ESIDVEPAENFRGNRFVSAGRNPCRTEVSAAYMHCDPQVIRPVRNCLIDRLQIFSDKIIGIPPLFPQLLFLFIGAEICPGSIIKLEISASCIVECTDGFFICCSQIPEEVIFLRIDMSVDFTPEMQHARTWYCEFRCMVSCLFLEVFEIFKERVVAKIQFSGHPDDSCLRLLFLELDAASGPVSLDPDHAVKEVEMPSGTAELRLCHCFEPDVLLLLYDSCNLFVFHRPQAVSREFT